MAHFRVLWTQAAQEDLVDIISYIQTDGMQRAKAIFEAIKKLAGTLEAFPQKGRVVPELQSLGITKYRELIYKRWRIVYRVDHETVYVLMVLDSSRDVEDLLFRRLMR